MIPGKGMGDKRQKVIDQLRNNRKSVKFSTLLWLCNELWGAGRQAGSHRIWKTGIAAIPTINLQPRGKDAKPYQVEQVLKVIDAAT